MARKRSGPPPTAGPLGDFVQGDHVEVQLAGTWREARLLFFLSGAPFVRLGQDRHDTELDPATPARLLRERQPEGEP